MAKIRKITDVSYLALQGGGGKGFAYIGAIEALEQLGGLPKKRGEKGLIQGFSGTSAGAITAMFLSIGCTSSDLLRIFKSNEAFLKFYDGPDPGFARAIRPGEWNGRIHTRDAWLSQGLSIGEDVVERVLATLSDLGSDAAQAIGQLAGPSTRLTGTTLLALWFALTPAGQLTRKAGKLFAAYPFARQITRNPSAYLSNVLYDRGIFPGFQVREFLRSAMREWLPKHPAWKKQLPDAADISFAELKDTTGVDLVVVGTNLSQHRSQYFSAETTPRFRVVEAVGISACFPMMFKPVWIDSHAGDSVLGELRGYWVDGGILNNIPIHAFDKRPPLASSRKSVASTTIHPNVLGLSLRPGSPKSMPIVVEPGESPLASLALDYLETSLMPAGPGQYALPDERDQVIDIFAYDLSLFNFAPTEADSRLTRKASFEDVLRYFST